MRAPDADARRAYGRTTINNQQKTINGKRNWEQYGAEGAGKSGGEGWARDDATGGCGLLAGGGVA